jgi:hypothetical protein
MVYDDASIASVGINNDVRNSNTFAKCHKYGIGVIEEVI